MDAETRKRIEEKARKLYAEQSPGTIEVVEDGTGKVYVHDHCRHEQPLCVADHPRAVEALEAALDAMLGELESAIEGRELTAAIERAEAAEKRVKELEQRIQGLMHGQEGNAQLAAQKAYSMGSQK